MSLRKVEPPKRRWVLTIEALAILEPLHGLRAALARKRAPGRLPPPHEPHGEATRGVREAQNSCATDAQKHLRTKSAVMVFLTNQSG